MTFEFNQTSSTIENNRATSGERDIQWYPFAPGQCPPTYSIILQGFCAPLIIIISTVLNSLIGVVLLQKHLRSPTNILLLAIALYDTLTGLFPFPSYIFLFTFRQCNDYMPYNYGWFHRICYDVLPFIFHTCSIWATVVLAIQRYVYVCYSEKAKKWCTVPMALKAIACVNILAVIVAIPMFIEGTFQVKSVQSLMDPNKIFNACAVIDYSEDPKYRTLFSIYSLIRALLINVGPCTILVILNAILVARMKEAKKNREKLIRRRSYESKTQEQSNVTLMLVIVVTMFLIVEIPMALYLITSGILRAMKSDFLGYFLHIAVQILNFAVLLSYPINFFIYCRMSRAFRDAFTKLICPSFVRIRQQHSQSIATPLITKKGGTMTTADQFELNHTSIKLNTSPVETAPPSSVIRNSTSNKTCMSSCNSLSQRISNDMKKTPIGSLGKPSVSFGEDINQLNNKNFMDL
ncbi:unnamed protein product [Rotaria magnacalcarata]|uniref:G-protein coupled receptors family 1 profile domain-containing protein n=1 Tax=Rotaria magnacalcarata TaxID=392030 RepID=A0A816WQC7_9BILA|nr:unnamed protein product [Rotaria magnacalcarata]CAF1467047.1 unnamed protein product [Rotaria magnacalcarata]CAF2135260.1 unnamed protein product [Rotaria magnacalcarata]CAF2137131.1 unnamed protein product [Rotaria magnacalcarata]CAF2172520.1 unnamed protein product [Rotaria magnacalcarata]